MTEPTPTNQSQPITPGEICVGDCLTVLEWNEPENPLDKLQSEDFTGTISAMIPFPTHAFMGDVLEVKALSLPYLLVENVSDHEDGFVWETIDTRDMDYRLLTPEFVEAVKGNKKTIAAKKAVDKEEVFTYAQRMADIQTGRTTGVKPQLPRQKGPQLQIEQIDLDDIDEDDEVIYLEGDELEDFLEHFGPEINGNSKPIIRQPNEEVLKKFLNRRKKDKPDEES